MRVSELSNSITSTIDEVDTVDECIQLFKQVDEQMFTGFESYENLNSPAIVSEMEQLCATVVDWLQQSESNRVQVLMGGAGTSGRLAFFAARRFRSLFHDSPTTLERYKSRIEFDYFMAGGDKGLIEAQEHAEDDVQLAKKDLKEKLKSRNKSKLQFYTKK